MNTKDPTILPLTTVPPGTRLAAAVLDAAGQVLLATGSILTEAMLETLARRGIVAVTVERQRDAAELDAAREALRQRLMHLFRRCNLEDNNGMAQMLYKATLDYRLDALR